MILHGSLTQVLLETWELLWLELLDKLVSCSI